MAADRRSSWLKGVLDLLVLSRLTDGESYGYEIAKALAEAGLGEIKGGTLYPVLNRLEEAGLVEAEFRAAERGPGRRYYRLTPLGCERLAAESRAWREFHRTVDAALHDTAPHDTAPPDTAPTDTAPPPGGGTA